MTTLDQRLYAWLLESDERRFELGFKAYFEVAYPSVVRRLVRLSRWDPVDLEELAQDSLLRFFAKVGSERREASELVRLSLLHLRPLNFGVFHERQVTGWTRDVGLFRESAMGFQPPQVDDTDWRSSIRALTERIPVLQKQGWHLLHSVHLELRWTFDGIESAASIEPWTDVHDQSDDVVPDHDQGHAAISRNCEEDLVDEILGKTERALIAEREHPGTLAFVQGTSIIVRALPHLRVPTNGYLFEIATTIFLDECKKRGRQKRGGTGVWAKDQVEKTGHADFASNHPIERLTSESFGADDSEERFEDAAPAKAASDATGLTVPSVDPTSRYEGEDLFEKFYEYLRRPIDDAIERFHIAQKSGGAVAERRKLDSLTNKFSRTMSVLSLMGEGYTQEQTAERLGLSRNQVKYIMESVQEAYTRFTREGARPSTCATMAAGDSHVA